MEAVTILAGITDGRISAVTGMAGITGGITVGGTGGIITVIGGTGGGHLRSMAAGTIAGDGTAIAM